MSDLAVESTAICAQRAQFSTSTRGSTHCIDHRREEDSMAKDKSLSTSSEAARVRLTLDISQKLNAIVDSLAAENDTTKADVLRFAVEVLSAATEAKKSG